ncbi:similar to Saccharomyces cerevisiae YKL022C CDC16 Subunit of the anaphase-promoting complex/cyclosome (APC/C) [Maudiozyma saulgeensis]|uniref:Similar to Saccharomyces cerevisiae YKL022C CDC16 Subunit of the anaphase-promoting complex/cyclosome (APC/C) n=1 Tax=Maudiozyma saulgeensis TaxID=1789683 RepID=A0A1X7QWH4_9SACH|nr:similar to Saccharomyces cerevisiae YKL022C CDC16 Subunit of the anaphase-promoting complex/cyclosome (APC/C) [Kazachstania saulgeensis]
MSPGRTPSQHNSTLAISPFITNRYSRSVAPPPQQQQQQQQQLTQRQTHSRTQNNEKDGDLLPNSSVNHSRIDNFQAIVSSPLGLKTRDPPAPPSLATPYHQFKGNNDSTRVKNGSMFGYAVPSTVRKVSIQENDYRNTTTRSNNNNNIDDVMDHSESKDGDRLTTTLTTTTTAATAADIDVSDLSSVERLRLWRHDALMQHMYDTAEFVGNKIYTITKDPNDAFWLAQVYYYKGSYKRTIDLLSLDNLDTTSIMCRYLITLCLFNLQKYDDALDIIGETNPFASSNSADMAADEDYDENHEFQSDGGIKIESSLCFLRGKIYSAQNNFTRAKECYKEAVLIDVKNFEAFQQLTNKNLLTPKEEWELLDCLDFSSLDDNKQVIKQLYTIACSNYINKDRIETSKRILCEEYTLESNVDVIKCEVELCFSNCKYNECLDYCERYLAKDELNPKILPTYIACLQELGATNKLFLVSHKLAERIPKDAITWYSVATYYMSLKKIGEARKFYSKSLIMDPSFAAAWLGFVHTFAAEGEQDQALAAYSTAARFFPGNHLPNMFLGMQYMSLNNYALAEEYFTLAYDICSQDPLLLNEMGVLYFKKDEYEKSKKFLNKAMEQVTGLNPTARTTISIQLNLAHTYRKLGDYERAIKCFKYVLEDSEKDGDIYLTLGFLYLKIKQLEKAISYLHKALALKPKNTAAQELLLHALELNVVLAIDDDHPLVVSSKIQNEIDRTEMSPHGVPTMEQAANIKKRPSIPFLDSGRTISKRSRRNDVLKNKSRTNSNHFEEDEAMDLE